MKFFLTLFISVGIIQVAFSQEMVKENAHWNVLVTNVFNYTSFTISYKFEGDSLLNGETYKKLWASYEEDNEIWILNDLLRETTDGKVFSADNTLHYDFSLVAGDTIQHTSDTNCFYLIETVDTIFLLDGSPRKRWTINSPEPFADFANYWIEGIGSTITVADYAQAFCALDFSAELLCYQESGMLLYQSGGDCFIVATEEQAIYKSSFQISIYPNPTTNYLNIYQYFSDATVVKSGQYRIVDSQGRIVEQFPVGENDVTMIIPIWEWAKGIYYLQLVVEERVVKVEKFVVQ